MSDITIPAADAKRLADYLRNFHFHGMSEEQDRLIALLDPPTPSLRDELIKVVNLPMYRGETYESRVEDVLAVVRRRVEALPVQVGSAMSEWIGRDDVLRLLDGAE